MTLNYLDKVSLLVGSCCACLFSSCSNSLNFEGLKYRSTGSTYVADLGQAVMIERSQANHVVPLARMNMDGVKFTGSSGKIYEEKTNSFTGSVTLKPVKVGSVVGGEASIGSEEGKPSWEATSKASRVLFYPAEYFVFLDQLNSPANRNNRARIYQLSQDEGSKGKSRAMGIVTRVIRSYGKEETRKISIAGKVSGKYTDGEFETKLGFSSDLKKTVEDKAVEGYLVGRIRWENPVTEDFKIQSVMEIDYVGIDSPAWRWLNFFVF